VSECIDGQCRKRGITMKLTTVSVNGRTGLAVGVGMGPNDGKRAVLWDGTEEISWVPNGDVMVTTPLDRV